MTLLPAFHVTSGFQLNACPVRLAQAHAIVARKGQLSNREDRGRLKRFIGGRERIGVQIPITRLFYEVGHRHEGVSIFPSILHLGTQCTDLLSDLPMIFACGTFAVCGFDEPFCEQGQDRLEHPLARCLGTQDATGGFHFVAFLATSMP